MKKFLAGAFWLATSVASTAAGAADLSGMNTGATIADFSGLGFGLDLGAAIGAAGSASTSGGTGGAHVGYNLQNGQIVGGVEADAMLTTIQGGLSGGALSEDFLSSARVKGGYVFGSLLAYGTLGGAWSTTDYSSLGNTSSRSLPGVSFGVGAEFAVTHSLSVRAELLRYNFQGASYATPIGSQSVTSSTNLLRVGVSARF
jgi:outer membrane immunogenic protein